MFSTSGTLLICIICQASVYVSNDKYLSIGLFLGLVWILQVFSNLNILSLKTAYKQEILKLMLCREADD